MGSEMAKIESVRDSFIDCKNCLARQHGEWDLETDARITMFSKCINVLNSAQLGMVFLDTCLSHKDFYKSISNDRISDEDAMIYCTEFSMFIKLGIVQFTFSSVESSFRAIVKAIDPGSCSDGTSNFEPIYNHLFKELDLKRLHYDKLSELFREVRNSLHNNGVYYPKETYVFSWDKDERQLKEFLKSEFDIGWVKTAEMKKIDDTIKLYTEINSLSLKLNVERTEVILEIDDVRIDRFSATMKKGELKIYYKKQKIVYKGTKYSFEEGKRIDFVTWDFLFDILFPDIKEMLHNVAIHPKVISITSIIDPYAKK
jgi:hypothetical protein